jgi:hypothetical protein
LPAEALHRLHEVWACSRSLELETVGDLPAKAKSLQDHGGVGEETLIALNRGLVSLARRWALLERFVPQKLDNGNSVQ